MSNSVETAIQPYIGEREIAGQNKNIALWEMWYKGYDPNFHNYKIYTGTKEKLSKVKKHLPTGKILCESWANLLMNEKTDVTMGESDKKLLDRIFTKCNFWHKANIAMEKMFALGICAFETSVKGLEVDEDGKIVSYDNAYVRVNCINGTKVYPITIEDDEVTECAFATSNTQNSFITIHLKDDETGHYKIITIFYKDKDFRTFDKKMEFDTESDTPWFACVSPNIVDNEDVNNASQLSIFANHIDEMKAIDNKYDLFDNEFRHGRKRTYISSKLQNISVDGELIKTFEGTEDDVFFVPQGDDGRNLIQNDTSDLRTSQIVEALNSELSMLGYACGFGKGFLTFNAESSGRPLQTATAVMMMNNDLFRTTHKHEIVIEQALRSVVTSVIYAHNNFTSKDEKFSKNATDKIEIKFDDSIFEDKEAEKNSARQDVQNGIMSEVEYRVKIYCESESDAQKKLLENPTYIANKINSLISALQSKAISPKEFVKLVWFKEDTEKENYIQEQLEKEAEITEEDMMKAMGGGKKEDGDKA